MGRRLLKVPSADGSRPSVISDRKMQTDLTIKEFLEMHTNFIKYKTLEGLAPRTLRDHQIHLGYFKKYLTEDHRSKLANLAIVVRGFFFNRETVEID